MDALKEGLFYERMADGRVLCTLCPHECKIGLEKWGICGVRFNEGGTLYTLVYGRVVARNLEPIEKKPLFHFRPGSTSYSIATIGCNLRCTFCQNWEISQGPKGKLTLTEKLAPEAPDTICPQLEAAEHRIIGELWVEVTTLVIPGLNDSDQELCDIARFVHSVGPEVPWHVTQFYPAYKMLDREHTPVNTLRHARQIGLSTGLRYVYEGNVPGEGGENTYCYACKALLIHRYGFVILSNRIRDGKCPDCRARIDGVEMDGIGS